MYENSRPGALARAWHKKKRNILQHTNATITALERVQLSRWLPDVSQEQTRLLPTPPTSTGSTIEKTPDTDKQKITIPRFVEYVHKDTNPMVSLYAAYLATHERMHTHPEALFISKSQLARLCDQTRALTGVEYDGFFRVYYGGNKADLIPVYTENMLPPALKMALASGVPPQNVIALCEPYK